MLAKNKSVHQEMSQVFDSLFRPEMVWNILEVIANTHAPSQTVHYTRAKVIQRLLQEFGCENSNFVPNYAKTGNALLSLDGWSSAILFFAHADEISYLVGNRNTDSWALIPFCNHRAEIEHKAIGLRYSQSLNGLEQVAEGIIKMVNYGNQAIPHFFTSVGTVQPGDRIVYHHDLSLEGDIVQGSLDNSAGVVACLLAAIALCQIAPQAPVVFAFTDEEEGPPKSNSTFGRGARRLVRRLASPDLCVIVDSHNISQWCKIGDGAVFAEKTTSCAGGVVPPHIYATFKELAEEMVDYGVLIIENPGYVSRSDDVACIEMTPNILLLGYPIKDPHFDQATPSASLSDILNLSKAVFWTVIGLGGDRLTIS